MRCTLDGLDFLKVVRSTRNINLGGTSHASDDEDVWGGCSPPCLSVKPVSGETNGSPAASYMVWS
jgi:hypothetical protein